MPGVAECLSSMALLACGFMVSRYELHTLPAQFLSTFDQMEHKSTLYGVFGGLSLIYLVILAPLYHLALKESDETSEYPYRYRTSSREHLRRRGSF